MTTNLKISDSLSALLSGHNEKALALLHNDRSPGATWSRMRALLRLRNFNRAIEIAETVDPALLVYEEVIAVNALHVFLLARAGRVKEAFVLLPLLKSSVLSSDELGSLEVKYIESYLDYCTGNYSACIAKIQEILVSTNSVVTDKRRYAFQVDAYMMRAKAATLIGVIYAAQARFVEMEEAHCDALLSAELAAPRDAFLEALVLANLSCSVGESYSASALRLLQNRVQSFSWNAGLEEHRVYIKRHLRVAAYVFTPSVDHHSIGGRSSPSFAFRLAECVDSLLLENWRSLEIFQNELAFAKEFISRVDWQITDGEEFTSLNEMIPILAPFDLKAAQDAQRRYDGKLTTLLPHFTLSSELRERASVKFANACMAKAIGDWASFEIEMRSVMDLWFSLGMIWRAAIAAVELFTLTRDEALLDIPRKFIADHPGTPFSRRLSGAVAMAPDADRGAFVYLREAISA